MSGYLITPRAARALTKMLRGNAASTTTTHAPATVSPDTFAPPFAVRWSQTEEKWVIWLPDPETLALVDDSYETISGVTAAQDLPTGWYTIDDVDDVDGEIWLVVTVTYSGSSVSSVSAELTNTAGTSSTGTVCYNLLVAVTDTDATTKAKYVWQFVNSAVTLATHEGGTPTSQPDPDGVSLDDNAANNAWEIYHFANPLAADNAATTIAADLAASGGGTDKVICRDANGALKYKSVGELVAGDVLEIDSNAVVATSTEYTGSSYTDPDTGASHPYAIKLTRGRLAFNNNGQLTVVADPILAPTQYIDTTPLSALLTAT